MMEKPETETIKGIVGHLTNEIKRLEQEIENLSQPDLPQKFENDDLEELVYNNYLMERLPLSIILMNKDLDIIRCNSVFENDFQLIASQLIGVNINSVFMGDTKELSYNLIKKEKEIIDFKAYSEATQKHFSFNFYFLEDDIKSDSKAVLGVGRDVTFNHKLHNIAEEFKF